MTESQPWVTAMYWSEPVRESPLGMAQEAELWKLAEKAWPSDLRAEFCYWLICNGYYVTINGEGVAYTGTMRDNLESLYCYVGRTSVIPISHFENVWKRLEKLSTQ